jgi:hypothetical protein
MDRKRNVCLGFLGALGLVFLLAAPTAAQFLGWEVNGAIYSANYPTPQSGDYVGVGTEVACHIDAAGDYDKYWYDVYPPDFDYFQDTFNPAYAYTWSATAGSWKDGDNEGHVVNWIAPSTPQSVTLSCAVADDAIYPPDKQGGNRNDPNLQPQVSVQVLNVELKSVKFTSDHGVLTNNNSNWDDGGTVYGEPEWVKGGQNNPISHTKVLPKVSVQVVVKVPSGSHFVVIGDGPGSYLDFTSATQTGTGSDQTVSMTASVGLPDRVDVVYDAITWTIRLTDPNPDQDVAVGTSGSHLTYVTYGTPAGSVVTEKRMAWACNTAQDASTVVGIADKIWEDFNTPPPYFNFENWPQTPLWHMMEGPQQAGQCIHEAELMKLAVQILAGDGTATRGYIFGSDDTDCYSTSPTAVQTRYCGTHGTEECLLVFSGGHWNNYESVCEASGKYYAMWPLNLSNTVAVQVLRDWLGGGTYQAWTYMVSGEPHECTRVSEP